MHWPLARGRGYWACYCLHYCWLFSVPFKLIFLPHHNGRSEHHITRETDMSFSLSLSLSLSLSYVNKCDNLRWPPPPSLPTSPSIPLLSFFLSLLSHNFRLTALLGEQESRQGCQFTATGWRFAKWNRRLPFVLPLHVHLHPTFLQRLSINSLILDPSLCIWKPWCCNRVREIHCLREFYLPVYHRH